MKEQKQHEQKQDMAYDILLQWVLLSLAGRKEAEEPLTCTDSLLIGNIVHSLGIDTVVKETGYTHDEINTVILEKERVEMYITTGLVGMLS